MRLHKDYIRSGVFGFEDALVSTTGMVVGIATGIDNKEFIILAVVVTIMVEAVSMAAGEFLSEKTLHQMEKRKHYDNVYLGALIMLVSYLLGGLIPILPIFFFSLPFALIPVLFSAFFGLFTLGYIKGKIVHVAPTRSALEMLLVGGTATIIGVVVGYFLKI